MQRDEPIVTKKRAGELKTLMQRLIPDRSQKVENGVGAFTDFLRSVLKECISQQWDSRFHSLYQKITTTATFLRDKPIKKTTTQPVKRDDLVTM